MPSPTPVAAPANYVTPNTLALGDLGESAIAVSAANPVPVAVRPFGGTVALTVGAADQAPGRGVRIACTIAGNVAVKLAHDSIETVPVGEGLSILPYAAKGIVAAGTTATATYAILA